MFDSVKRIFSRQPVENKPSEAISNIVFQDLKQQTINLKIKPNANDTVFAIQEKRSATELIFDKEQCLLLAAIFSEYANTGKLSNISNIFTGEEK